MVIVGCGCRSDWLCVICAKCATCCKCDTQNVQLVHSNSSAGAHSLANNARKRREAER